MTAVYVAGRLVCGLCVGASVGMFAWIAFGAAKGGGHA